MQECAQNGCELSEENKYSRNMILLRRAKEGDDEAAEELLKLNTGLIRSIAARFNGRGTEFDDLIQIGSIGMIKAIRSFDFDRGTVFSTYAVPLIIGELRKHFRDDGIIKVSRIIKKRGMDLARAKEKFLTDNGRDPRIDELAELCGLDIAEAAEALEASAGITSLSGTAGDDEGYTLEAILEDESCEMESRIEGIALSQAMGELPELWQKILLLRFWRDYSQQQTADALGLTQVKISREEKKIFAHLRLKLG